MIISDLTEKNIDTSIPHKKYTTLAKHKNCVLSII